MYFLLSYVNESGKNENNLINFQCKIDEREIDKYLTW